MYNVDIKQDQELQHMLFMSRFPFLINNSSFQPTGERFIVWRHFTNRNPFCPAKYFSALTARSPDLICIASSDFAGAKKNLQNFLPHKQKHGLSGPFEEEKNIDKI